MEGIMCLFGGTEETFSQTQKNVLGNDEVIMGKNKKKRYC